MDNAAYHSLPLRFQPAYRALARLAEQPRYLGAFIFGSVAHGDATDASDCDVRVAVDAANPCQNINHPTIGGVKLDITFSSLAQLQLEMEKQMAERRRPPWIAGALIVFDKTGELSRLRAEAEAVRPKPLTDADRQFIQFMVYHADDKVSRHLTRDPAAALLVMHTSVLDLIHFHYQIQGRWQLSNKRILADLRTWDAPFAALVEHFVALSDARAKQQAWAAIIDHVLAPLGGRQPISENNCDCPVCCNDLATLLAGEDEASP
jgi:hypothetical protein